MKKIFHYLILLMIILVYIGIRIFIKNSYTHRVVLKSNLVAETNLSNLRVNIYPERIISYGSGLSENIPDNPIFLFINGSIKNTCLDENGVILIPLSLVAESFGVRFKWDEGTDKVYIIDGDNLILWTIGDYELTFNNSLRSNLLPRMKILMV